MVRLNTSGLAFKPGPKPDLDRLAFCFNAPFQDAIRPIPGVRWDPALYSWIAPTECRSLIAGIAGEFQLPAAPFKTHLAAGYPLEINPKLHEYQQASVAEALYHRSYMLNFEMGLGKTPAAIEAMHLGQCQSAIIVCPAMVRLNWLDELDRWWPGHPEATAIEDGKQAAIDATRIRVVSYELLHKLVGCAVDAVIIDESHYIGNSKAGRSKTVRALLDANPTALRLALTATPITNQPKTLHFQLDSLWPDRFGSWPKFNKRYSIVEDNGYSKWCVKGLNEEHADELRERLSALSARVTKKEVAHLLPPCLVQTLRVQAQRKGFSARELLDRFERLDAHNNQCIELIRAAGSEKVGHAVEQAQLGFDSGASHVAVLTHFKETAREVASRLESEGHYVVLVTGDNAPAERHQLLKQLKEHPNGCLVATMHAVNVGIDLTFCTLAIFAELDYTPSNMIQALGRFSRLSGLVPSTIILLVLEGTQDELIAHRLQIKIDEINQVVRAGHAEGNLAEAFNAAADQTDEDFFASMQSAVSRVKEREEYV